MNITLRENFGFELTFEDGDVIVVKDIEDRIYSKTENGKTDFRSVTYDIKTEIIEQFVSVLADMIYYRKADFDSSYLIKELFKKLPQETVNNLLEELKHDYGMDVE